MPGTQFNATPFTELIFRWNSTPRDKAERNFIYANKITQRKPKLSVWRNHIFMRRNLHLRHHLFISARKNLGRENRTGFWFLCGKSEQDRGKPKKEGVDIMCVSRMGGLSRFGRPRNPFRISIWVLLDMHDRGLLDSVFPLRDGWDEGMKGARDWVKYLCDYTFKIMVIPSMRICCRLAGNFIFCCFDIVEMKNNGFGTS